MNQTPYLDPVMKSSQFCKRRAKLKDDPLCGDGPEHCVVDGVGVGRYRVVTLIVVPNHKVVVGPRKIVISVAVHLGRRPASISAKDILLYKFLHFCSETVC